MHEQSDNCLNANVAYKSAMYDAKNKIIQTIKYDTVDWNTSMCALRHMW